VVLADGPRTGYREQLGAVALRRELPSSDVVLVVGFGDPVEVLRSPGGPGGGSCTSLVAGLHDSLAITGHRGHQAGIAVRLSPLRAYSLLGLPLHLVSNQLVDLSDVLGRDADRLADQLATAAGWRQRFDLLGAALAGRVAAGPVPDRAVAWAWRQLRAAAGVLPIGELAAQIGWSRRHLERRFRQQVGLHGLVQCPFGHRWLMTSRTEELSFAEIQDRFRAWLAAGEPVRSSSS
jgi:AraC-like DNA-binding protein